MPRYLFRGWAVAPGLGQSLVNDYPWKFATDPYVGCLPDGGISTPTRSRSANQPSGPRVS